MAREFVKVTLDIEGQKPIEFSIPVGKVHGMQSKIRTEFRICKKCHELHPACWCKEKEISLKETRAIFKNVCKKHNITSKQSIIFRRASKERDLSIIDEYLSFLKVEEQSFDMGQLTLEKVDEIVDEINTSYNEELKTLSTESLERFIQTAKHCNRTSLSVDVCLSELTERALLRE